MLVAVDHARCGRAHVGRGADHEQDAQQERLEVEQCRLRAGRSVAAALARSGTHHDDVHPVRDEWASAVCM